uniref:Acidic ribosomal protein P2 n=1 Tax=Oxytricha trifallax TaxID=94289 RepID=A7Y486_OXYTR|nr:acidic ribosomal protein P2 [Sterkiella histriomuscorum]
MKYIAAYALLVLGGKAEPSVADVEKVLKEAGIKSETDHAERLVSSLKGKAFHELVASGKSKMSSMGSVVSAPAAGGAAPAKAAAVVEEKKEEEADVDMGGLFGDDY